MQRAPIQSSGSGAIINIASVAGLVGTAPEILDAAGYAASKGAVIAFTRDLAVKWEHRATSQATCCPSMEA